MHTPVSVASNLDLENNRLQANDWTSPLAVDQKRLSSFNSCLGWL